MDYIRAAGRMFRMRDRETMLTVEGRGKRRSALDTNDRKEF